VNGAVLDASAVLAVVQLETGSDIVEPMVPDAAISAANWSEVLQRLLHADRDWRGIGERLRGIGLRVEPVTVTHAEIAAQLWHDHPQLSLADRLCLALAARLDTQAVTADKAWRGIPHVLLIR